jgi:hypothetical protein
LFSIPDVEGFAGSSKLNRAFSAGVFFFRERGALPQADNEIAPSGLQLVRLRLAQLQFPKKLANVLIS